MAPVARGLQDAFRVLEPFQRRSGGEPLSVARHVADLHELLEARLAGERPALVGSSWGAMLALAFAAEHPGRRDPLVLIGCGTFDASARRCMEARLAERLKGDEGRRLRLLAKEVPDPDERLRAAGELLLPAYSYEPASTDLETERCDARGHRETWDDMVRLQEAGVYPRAFAAIRAPVLMLHGAADPHPGDLIRAGLEAVLPGLEYREWERCGHYPWLETHARESFFEELRGWLARVLG